MIILISKAYFSQLPAYTVRFKTNFPFRYRFTVVFLTCNNLNWQTNGDWTILKAKRTLVIVITQLNFVPMVVAASYQHDLSQAMKAMPSVTVQAKRYRHTTMRARWHWQSLPTINKRVNHCTRLHWTKARGPDGQFPAPTCISVNSMYITRTRTLCALSTVSTDCTCSDIISLHSCGCMLAFCIHLALHNCSACVDKVWLTVIQFSRIFFRPINRMAPNFFLRMNRLA